MPKARVFSGTISTPAKSPVKIPLNDDRQEKANRLHSRQAQHEMHMNQIKAAATPLRKRQSLLGRSPRTPGDGDEDVHIGGSAVTPMKRVPILANFEEWMKMATDNKINATNSWNFALIDYFHDMSLLKEGDGVNFQRASCTLDGCVKIYTNRVDSVATDTNRLLTGLADSKNNDEEVGEAGSDVEDGEDEDGNKKKTKKRAQRSESTLASSFSQLQVKKMELEFAIDPLFKKASADFDEGGAKGLLLNHLSIDGSGRIVFDSSDDIQELNEDEEATDDADDVDVTKTEIAEQPASTTDVDLGSLAAKFFPDLSILQSQDVCASLKTFELGNGDASLDLPFLKAPEEWKQQTGGEIDQNGNATAIGGDDDDDNLLGGLDLVDEVGFGEGGEVWAREVALEPQMRLYNAGMEENAYDSDAGEDREGDGTNARYAISMRTGANDEQQNILDYFDKALKSNWAGPEHWKIRKVKDSAAAANQAPTKRKEREPFEIDFLSPMSQQLADALYTPAATNSAISLPKAQWKSKSRNLLPDDKHFSSRQLLRLFLKPNASLARKSVRSHTATAAPVNPGDVDEEYWARQQDGNAAAQEEGVQGNYDANFFQDDGFNLPGADEDEDDEFADARDHFSPEAEAIPAVDGEELPRPGSQEGGAYGAQLVTQSRRLRPEYVQYARVAKKVDVRRLKEEIWKGLAFEQLQVEKDPMAMEIDQAPDDKTLQFTDVVNSLQTVYPKQAMADISTSYCFICVLHLANEKGLVIENHDNFSNLSIRKDHTAEIVGLA